ncbi:MAG: aryl-sulfate sulfotransferase [Candidatus Thermoplasmatota archaeon]
MDKKLIRKIIIFFTIILVISNISTTSLSQNQILNKKKHPNIESNPISSSYNNTYQTSKSDIQIADVKGGLNLAVTVENKGSITYRNVEIIIKIKGGILLTPRNKEYTIPLLTPNGEDRKYTLQNQLFGLSINTFNPLHISLLLNNSGNPKVIGQIDSFLIGPYIKITNSMLNKENLYEGYNLFTPEYGKDIYLMDNSGDIVHKWDTHNIQGMATYLLENGNIIRTDFRKINPNFPSGGITGHAAIYDPNGTHVWDFIYSNKTHCLHHDIEPLPNGNFLMSAWEIKTYDELIEAGRNPDTFKNRIFSDHIIEVKPKGRFDYEIVWEWNVWDHLIQDYDETKDNYGVVADHPELIDINYGESGSDFTHINSIDYNEELNQILLSVREFNEIWVIDHSTTTEEAANHSGGKYGNGGDLLYRWGNPAAYRKGDEEDQQLFNQHDATWIEDNCPGSGNILIFNNDNPSIDESNPNLHYSSVIEITPPVDIQGNYIKIGPTFGPRKPTWSYMDEDNPHDFYSFHLSSAQRLPNGNTLMCEGNKGKFTEVTEDKEIVWQYTNPYGTPNHVFKIHRYSPDHPGIQSLLK